MAKPLSKTEMYFDAPDGHRFRVVTLLYPAKSREQVIEETRPAKMALLGKPVPRNDDERDSEIIAGHPDGRFITRGEKKALEGLHVDGTPKIKSAVNKIRNLK